jgi:hypothetical protein
VHHDDVLHRSARIEEARGAADDERSRRDPERDLRQRAEGARASSGRRASLPSSITATAVGQRRQRRDETRLHARAYGVARALEPLRVRERVARIGRELG